LTPIIVLEAAGLLLVCWLVARWRGRKLRRRLFALRVSLDRQAVEAARARAATIATPTSRHAAPLRPGDRVRTTVALNALSALDATDILLVTRYTLDRAEPGSALGEAAGRVRAIGERAADNLGIAPHLHGPGAAR